MELERQGNCNKGVRGRRTVPSGERGRGLFQWGERSRGTVQCTGGESEGRLVKGPTNIYPSLSVES